MSAKSDRAVRMARAANRGNPTAAGFPIVDEVTLRLRVREYLEALKRVEEAQRQVGLLFEHIVRRAFALAEKHGPGVLGALPQDWVEGELMRREFEESKGRVAERLAAIAAAGSPPYEHTMGGE